MLMHTQTPIRSTRLICRFQTKNQGKPARTKSVRADHATVWSVTTEEASGAPGGIHTTSKDGIVHDRRGVDAVPWNAVVPFLGERSAADEEGDGARPHEAVDGDDAYPYEHLVPPFDGEAQERDAEGRLGDGDADDAEELADEEQHVGLCERLKVGDLEDMLAQAVLR